MAKARSPRLTPRKADKLLSKLLAVDGLHMLLGLNQDVQLIEAVVPPGTLLDVIVEQVKNETDLPPEIALTAFFSIVSAALAQQGVTVAWHDDPANPAEMALWLVVLAPSGAGKTWIRNLITQALGIALVELPEPGSARVFLDSLQQLDGRATFVRDEYGQLMKAITDGGPLGQLRDYLLRSYDHSKIETTTRSAGSATVQHPVLSIFGSTVASTWSSCVDAAMLADGLLARHLFVVAQARPLAVPRYPTAQMAEKISRAADSLKERLAGLQGARFTISREGLRAYEQRWHETKGMANLDAAYFRRVTWTATRYAVLYHLLLERDGFEVGADAMRWAWRMVRLHLQYARQTLELSDPGAARKLERAVAWVQQEAGKGRDTRSHDFMRALLQRFSRDLASMADARTLIDIAMRTGATSP